MKAKTGDEGACGRKGVFRREEEHKCSMVVLFSSGQDSLGFNLDFSVATSVY
jgi:hypothetical protein